jgi:membrane protein
MARLSDVPVIWRTIGPKEFVLRVWREMGEDDLFVWAAAMAYSWLFAIFPFLLFLLGLLPFIPSATKDTALKEIQQFVYSTMPQAAADTIWNNVYEILSKPHGGILGIGLLLTLWGASGGMNMTVTALERCYEIDPGRPFYKKRPVAIGLTFIVATLILLVVVLLPVGTLAIKWLETRGQNYLYVSTPAIWTLRIIRYPLALLVMFTVVNVVYFFGPAIRQRYIFITPGGLFCVLVWIMLGLSFRIYVDKFGKYNETYGTVGGVAILLLFFYFDAAVLLVGAEINSEIDFETLKVPRGSRNFRRVYTEPEAKQADSPAASSDPPAAASS